MDRQSYVSVKNTHYLHLALVTILSLMDEWGLTRSIYCFRGKVESVVPGGCSRNGIMVQLTSKPRNR